MADLLGSFSEPFYTGAATAQQVVPHLYPVALGGVGFLVDTLDQDWHDESIPILRPQQDNSTTPSEVSLSPESLWRRGFDTWHEGAGQEIYDDADDSSRKRFRSSLGVDIWDKGKLKLLPSTTKLWSASDTNNQLLAVGSRVFVSDDNDMYWSDNGGASWTAVLNSPTGDILSFTTDGYYIYATNGADVFRFQALAASPDFGAAWNTLNCTLIKFVKGRLMAAQDDKIYEITSSAAPSAHFTHPNSNFRWVDFTEGTKAIYAGGQINSLSTIYKIVLLEDASGLDVPIVTTMIDERLYSLGSFLGSFIFLGVATGVRFAVADTAGDLSLGALLETGTPCRCFTGEGQQVRFGWDNFDASHTGLGRFSLENFASLELLAPAYASDLMASGVTGAILGAVNLDGTWLFSVAGQGVYAQSDDLVTSGYIESGEFDYGLTSQKIALFADTQATGAGTFDFYFKEVDDSEYTLMGQQPTVGLSEKTGYAFEWKLVLNRDTTDAETGPIIRAVTIRSHPIVRSSEFMFIPLMLAESYKISGRDIPRDPAADLEMIKGWRQNRDILSCAQGSETVSVILDDYIYKRRLGEHPENGFIIRGTCTVKLKVLE